MSMATESSLRRVQWMTGGGALLTLVGSLVLSCPWGLRDLPTGGPGLQFVTSPRGLGFLSFVALGWCGVLMMWRAEVRLKKGLGAGRWKSAEVDRLRRRIELPLWAPLYWTAALLVILESSMSLGPQHSASPALWVMMLFPMQALSRIRVALRPSKDEEGISFPWSGMKPIRSEHWGER